VSSVAKSNGVTVDKTAPTAGTANDGSGADITYQTDRKSVVESRSGFTDGGSGIDSYEWAIGSTAGGTEVQDYTAGGTTTSATPAGVGLADGTKYDVSVRAIDEVENVSSVAKSNGVTIDKTVPTAGTVKDGTGADITYQ